MGHFYHFNIRDESLLLHFRQSFTVYILSPPFDCSLGGPVGEEVRGRMN